MTTNSKSTEAAPSQADKSTRRFRPTVYAYRRVPTQGLQRIMTAKLDGAPIRLWLALSALSNGHESTVTISNGELLKAAQMTDPKMVRTARAALVKASVLTATPVGGRREVYVYDLAPRKQQVKTKRHVAASTVVRKRRSELDDLLSSNPSVNSWGDDPSEPGSA